MPKITEIMPISFMLIYLSSNVFKPNAIFLSTNMDFLTLKQIKKNKLDRKNNSQFDNNYICKYM